MSRSITIAAFGGNRHNLTIDCFPSKCGLCHKQVDPTFISGAFNNGSAQSNKMELAFQCTNRECSSLIIGYYLRESASGTFKLQKHAPVIPINKEFNAEILEVSSNFIEIYNQSLFAEQTGLTLISGIGYRKSLEFLIKDYLIFLDGEKEEEISKKPLGQCINELNNNNIKEIAKRATWIGNDEAHYTRKWGDKDINDLKKLIDVTVYFIAMDVAAKKYLKEMS
ncbi:DUF4145 domain-containing protein [Alkalihalobacterium alkalinitrilicum]|uniref:DUF4145 domain-containing protein n=1 Tax=Alkalihalobacterium alkalinitrilicum TaxID=427920 RepID=UPI0009959CE2|nr:DUF4145 domain-containing protein [Alkalihalobacterium alkalinitrilicum]